MRKFEKVTYIDNATLPVRGSALSAGYDFCTCEDVVIKPGEVVLVKTGIKAQMMDDEVLKIYVRSSVGFKQHIRLANSVGIIDADYYNNPDNEGHIMIPLHNFGTETRSFKVGDRIAQGIFEKYLVVDGDEVTSERTGGFGSTS